MIICPVCRWGLEQNQFRMTYDCDNCGFWVSQLEAYRLYENDPQKAAELKMADMIYKGWTPYGSSRR